MPFDGRQRELGRCLGPGQAQPSKSNRRAGRRLAFPNGCHPASSSFTSSAQASDICPLTEGFNKGLGSPGDLEARNEPLFIAQPAVRENRQLGSGGQVGLMVLCPAQRTRLAPKKGRKEV